MPRPLQFAVFLSIVLLIIGTADAVVWSGLALTFTLTSPQTLWLAGLLAVLSFGFIGMMILSSYYYNIFTRAVYTLLATWMGAFAYLFFASVALGLIAAAEEHLTIVIAYQTLGLWLYAGALVVSAHGVWHAKQIKVARYEVRLPNLPDAWLGKKLAFVSDFHLGQLHGPEFAAKSAQAIMCLEPDLICIGGDLYDGTQAPSPLMLAEPLRMLAAPLGVYYITGNHEEFGDSSAFLQAVRALGITILMDEKKDIEGLQLVGVDYHNARTTEGFTNILAGLKLDPAQPSVLLKHEPNHLHIAEAAGVNLQLSGHTHYGQQWPFGLIAQLNYQGYAYGLKNFGNMQQLTSSGIGTWGPPVRVGSNSEIVLNTFV
jgi:hypothetical protein